ETRMAKGEGEALSPEAVADIVARAAEEARQHHLDALDQMDWQRALEHNATALLWRAIALAIRLKLTRPGVLRADGGALAIAQAVGHECMAAMLRLEKTSDPSSVYQKAGYIHDVMFGIAESVLALETGRSRPRSRLLLVAVNSMALGRHDMTLAMAEAGHWDTIGQVARMRSKAGRATARVNRQSAETGWQAEAWPVIRKHLKGPARTRKEWAELIEAEVSGTPSVGRIEKWIASVVEEPNGPLPTRKRKSPA
ncbi:MAG: hypothetical protein KF777_24510, partial [Planctomycetaceae bacterium]|nr:hypothetical protein [Planctomycetaceae bacterium]